MHFFSFFHQIFLMHGDPCRSRSTVLLSPQKHLFQKDKTKTDYYKSWISELGIGATLPMMHGQGSGVRAPPVPANFKCGWNEKRWYKFQCCRAGADRSRIFLAGAGADLKFYPWANILGWLRLLFSASEIRKDLNLKMLIFSLFLDKIFFLSLLRLFIQILSFPMFCIKIGALSEQISTICFSEPESGGAEVFWEEPEPNFFTRSQKKKF